LGDRVASKGKVIAAKLLGEQGPKHMVWITAMTNGSKYVPEHKSGLKPPQMKLEFFFEGILVKTHFAAGYKNAKYHLNKAGRNIKAEWPTYKGETTVCVITNPAKWFWESFLEEGRNWDELGPEHTKAP